MKSDAPRREIMPFGGWTSCLPPARRVRQPAEVPLETMPKVFDFVLVELIATDVPLSKGKARKAILHGKVTVNEKVVRDPDMRVDGTARVVYKP